MICSNCGTSNLDNSSICINCGRPLAAAAPAPQVSQSYTPPPPPQPSYGAPQPSYGAPAPGAAPPGGSGPVVYLIFSILMVLCCCNPFALVPLVFAIMSMSRRSAGDYAGAAVNAGRTVLWFWIAVVALIVWNIIFFMFMGGMATIEEIRRNLPQ